MLNYTQEQAAIEADKIALEIIEGRKDPLEYFVEAAFEAKVVELVKKNEDVKYRYEWDLAEHGKSAVIFGAKCEESPVRKNFVKNDTEDVTKLRSLLSTLDKLAKEADGTFINPDSGEEVTYRKMGFTLSGGGAKITLPKK